jgi:hypothetical protein
MSESIPILANVFIIDNFCDQIAPFLKSKSPLHMYISWSFLEKIFEKKLNAALRNLSKRKPPSST